MSKKLQVDWFDNAAISSGIGRKSFLGFSLTFGSQILKFGVNFGATAVLARLLAPGDFGLVAMILSITGAAQIFKDLGLSAATVQRPHINHKQINCLFWLTVLIGVLVSVVVSLLGPAMAIFYHDNRITAIAPVIGLTYFIGSFGAQHQALLRRHMQFGTVATIEVIGSLMGYLLAIALALRGFGYWALVIQQVATFFIITVFSWVVCSWRPSLPTWDPTTKSMIGFGGNVTGSSLLSYACRNVDNILIGWVCGPVPLGLYSKAYQLLLLPIWQINTPMLSVVTPALSRLQFEPERFKQLYLKATFAIVALGMPAVTFMVVRAEDVVLLALGKEWTGAVILFRLLAPAAFMDTFNITAGFVFNTLGRADRQLRLGIVASIITMAGFAVGIRWGAPGVAVAFSVVTCAIRFPALMYAFVDSPLRMTDIFGVLWRPAICSIVPGFVLFLAPHSISGNALNIALSLFRDCFLYTAMLAVMWLLIPKGWMIIRETCDTVLKLIRKSGGR